jgi:hypothetical protein
MSKYIIKDGVLCDPNGVALEVNVNSLQRTADEILHIEAPDEVKAIQQMLSEADKPVGPIDGVMGDKTQNSLTEFVAKIQLSLQDEGLYNGAVDGEYTQELRNILERPEFASTLTAAQRDGFQALNTLQDLKVSSNTSVLDVIYSPADVDILSLENIGECGIKGIDDQSAAVPAPQKYSGEWAAASLPTDSVTVYFEGYDKYDERWREYSRHFDSFEDMNKADIEDWKTWLNISGFSGFSEEVLEKGYKVVHNSYGTLMAGVTVTEEQMAERSNMSIEQLRNYAGGKHESYLTGNLGGLAVNDHTLKVINGQPQVTSTLLGYMNIEIQRPSASNDKLSTLTKAYTAAVLGEDVPEDLDYTLRSGYGIEDLQNAVSNVVTELADIDPESSAKMLPHLERIHELTSQESVDYNAVIKEALKACAVAVYPSVLDKVHDTERAESIGAIMAANAVVMDIAEANGVDVSKFMEELQQEFVPDIQNGDIQNGVNTPFNPLKISI